jgi:hypothetical protein
MRKNKRLIYICSALIAAGCLLLLQEPARACNYWSYGAACSSVLNRACDEYCIDNAGCDAQIGTMVYLIPHCSSTESGPGYQDCPTSSYLCTESYSCFKGYHSDYCEPDANDPPSTAATRFCRQSNYVGSTYGTSDQPSGASCP